MKGLLKLVTNRAFIITFITICFFFAHQYTEPKTPKTNTFFVSYFISPTNGGIGWGNSTVTTKFQIKSLADVQQIEKDIDNSSVGGMVTIINYQEIK